MPFGRWKIESCIESQIHKVDFIWRPQALSAFPQPVNLETHFGDYLPVTPGSLDAGRGKNLFVSKLVIEDDLALALSASPSPVAHGGLLAYTIAATSKGPDFATNLRVTDVLPARTTFVSDNAGGGSCTARRSGIRAH